MSSKEDWNNICQAAIGSGRLCMMDDYTISIRFYKKDIAVVRQHRTDYVVFNPFTGITTFTDAAETIDYVNMIGGIPWPTLPESVRRRFVGTGSQSDNGYIKLQMYGQSIVYYACAEFTWVDDTPNYRLVPRGDLIKIDGVNVPYTLERLVERACVY